MYGITAEFIQREVIGKQITEEQKVAFEVAINQPAVKYPTKQHYSCVS
jgi:hypothetical protein